MKRVKYVSQWTSEMRPEDVHALALRAAEQNAKLDVTGVLVTSGRVFFQIIEGPDAHIDELFQTIRRDERHRDVLLLAAEEGITERFFPDWSMREMNLDEHAERRLEPVRELLSAIVARQEELQRLTLGLERALWHELASLD